jgi:SagB-type dehydrogenase family enzyme
MILTKLDNPVPRDTELEYAEFEYPIVSREFLPEPDMDFTTSFSDILLQRKSRRSFNSLSPEQKNSFLWHSSRTLEVDPSASRWQHRSAPSAGGRHPIDLFVIEPHGSDETIFLYQPESHCLAKLRSAKNEISNLILEANNVLPSQQATIVWFGAQFDRTMSKYEHGESLVWKDAGALISVMALVAEALQLKFCPLGITGEPFISRTFQTKKLSGVGGVYIGS